MRRPVHLASRLLLLQVALAFSASTSSSSALAENWPQWRGPRWNGVSSETNLPTEWSREKNVAWRFPLPGRAGATPAVWEDRIFVSTTTDSEDLLLLCIGTDGKERWRQVVGRGEEKTRGDEGDTAGPSPTTDGRHVWCFMGTGDLACCTVEGKQVWHVNLQERFGEFDIQFGMSSTPVLHNGMLLLQLIHGSMQRGDTTEPAIVAALDAATGKTIWKVARKTGAVIENKHSYASPILYDFDGLTLLITHGSDHTIAYDPRDGDEVWRFGSFNPPDSPGFNEFLRFVASPGVGPGIVVCPTAKRGPVYAIHPDSKGNVPVDGKPVLWSLERGTPDVPTPLVHDGLVYLCDEVGLMRCVDAKSGKVYYQDQETQGRRKVRSSPVYADGHIYVTNRDGHVTVVKAGKKFEIVAANDSSEDQTATPAISNGTIYLRTFEALWAIRSDK